MKEMDSLFFNSGLFLALNVGITHGNNGHSLTRDVLLGYSRLVRPRVNFSEPVKVYLEFELIQIIELEEKKQVLTSSGFFVARWFDDYLTWQPEKYGGIKEIVLPPTEVWLPDFGIENSAVSFYQDTYQKHFHVRVRYDGHMQWSFGGEIFTLCPLDLTMFPFDHQECHLTLENWAYRGDEVDLYAETDTINMGSYISNGVWDVTSTEVKRESHYYQSTGNLPFPEIEFVINLQRKPAYYLMNLVVPCVFIIIVALGIYWVPPESGEKVSLAITVLLAFSVFQLVIRDQMPVNSDFSPMLGHLVISLMAISSISTMVAIWVLYLSMRDCHHPIPNCIRQLVFKYLATILCMHKSLPDLNPDFRPNVVMACNGTAEHIKSKVEEVELKNEENEQLAVICSHLEYITSKVKVMDKDTQIMAEWKALAKIIDRLMFWLSLITLIIVVVLFMTGRGEKHTI